MDRTRRPPAGTRILKLPPDGAMAGDEQRFELDFLLALTTEQRFRLMLERSRQMAESLEAHGHRAPSSTLKRT